MSDSSDKNKPPKNKLNGKDSNVAPFPGEKERISIQVEKVKAQKNQEKSKSEPILNLPPCVKIFCTILIVIHIILYTLVPVKYLIAAYAYLSFLPFLYLSPLEHIVHILTMPFTHALLHGGWIHLGVNIAMLGAFGSVIERTVHWRGFMMIFWASVLAGAMAHLILFWGSTGPMVGASGGISGLFGALLRLMQDRGHMRPGLHGLLPICALWIGISILFALFGHVPGETAEIAWSAHLGGFLAGLFIYPWVMRRVRQRG